MKFAKLKIAALIFVGVFASSNSMASVNFAKCLSEPAVKFDGTIVDAAIATPALSTLVTAVVAADLVETLANADNVTVFAPTNEAFNNIPGAILSDLLADVDALTGVLAYHVAPGNRDPRVRLTATRVETLAGQSIFMHRKGGYPMVNDSIVSCTPVRTNNGTVYVVDSVLMPQY